MPSSKSADDPSSGAPSLAVKDEHIEYGFIGKLQSLKYEYRPDIRDRAALERNFRGKFEALNRVHLSDGEFTGGSKLKMSREQLIGIIAADAKFMNERDDIAAYINTLKAGEGLSETAISEGYLRFKKERDSAELAAIATRHGLATPALQAFVDQTPQRLILDGDVLSALMEPLQLGWKARAQAETALMAQLMPLLSKRAQGREISGLSAYE